MNLSQKVTQRQELRQTLVQKQVLAILQAQILNLRLDLIQTLTGDRYRSEGICPECLKRLTTMEILQGFNQDPQDFTTGCPGCGCRFEPKLICVGEYSRIEVSFLCATQLLVQLRGKERLSPDQLAQKYVSVYRSAIMHFGNISAAFKKVGIEYRLEKFPDWQKKITPFLGKLPDTIIATHANIPVYQIRKIRTNLEIPRFLKSEALESIVD